MALSDNTWRITPSEQQAILIQDSLAEQTAASVGGSGQVDSSQFVFLGLFDGTGNNFNNDSNSLPTNIGALSRQYQVPQSLRIDRSVVLGIQRTSTIRGVNS